MTTCPICGQPVSPDQAPHEVDDLLTSVLDGTWRRLHGAHLHPWCCPCSHPERRTPARSIR